MGSEEIRHREAWSSNLETTIDNSSGGSNPALALEIAKEHES